MDWPPIVSVIAGSFNKFRSHPETPGIREEDLMVSRGDHSRRGSAHHVQEWMFSPEWGIEGHMMTGSAMWKKTPLTHTELRPTAGSMWTPNRAPCNGELLTMKAAKCRKPVRDSCLSWGCSGSTQRTFARTQSAAFLQHNQFLPGDCTFSFYHAMPAHVDNGSIHWSIF